MKVEQTNGIEPKRALSTNIFERAVGLSIRLSKMGDNRKVTWAEASEANIHVDADKEMIRISKSILDCEELKAVKRQYGEIKRYLYDRCLPSPLPSLHLLPIEILQETDRGVAERITKAWELIDKFVEAYPERVQEASRRLNLLYDVGDYPTQEEVRQKFAIRVQYVNFSVPEQLKKLSQELFEREKDRMERVCLEATEEIRNVLRSGMAELVARMVDRLSPTADGKRKVFRDTLVSNMEEFLGLFDARNLADDADLKALVDKARGVLKGVDPELLRSETDIRERVLRGFEEIKNAVDKMVVEPQRKIEFDELED